MTSFLQINEINKMNKKIIMILITSLSLGFSFECIAKESTNIQVGRYITLQNQPKKSQINLLSQNIQLRFPQNVQTIEGAINHLLRFSGYSLIEKARMSDALKIVLGKPLPLVDRDFGPMSLKDCLQTLVGPAFSLEQNPINRTVNFNLKSSYAKTYHFPINVTKQNIKRA